MSRGEAARYIDYLGPDIDLGFRIAHFAQPSAIAVSLDLLEAILPEAAGFAFFRGADAILTGVNSGRPYPIIWARPAGAAFALEDAAGSYRRIGAAIAAGPVAPDALHGLVESLRRATG
jgi:hypothetical protein